MLKSDALQLQCEGCDGCDGGAANAACASSDQARGHRRDDRLATAMRALLAGVIFATALSTTAVVAYVSLEQKLKVQETKLAHLLAQLGSEELTQEVDPDIELSVEVRQADSPAPRAARNIPDGRPDLPLPDSVLSAAVAGQYSAHVEPLHREPRRQLSPSGSSGLAYMEWQQTHHTGLLNGRPTNAHHQQLSLQQQQWLLINVSGLYYVYSQVTFWGQHMGLHSSRQRSNLLQRIVVSQSTTAPHRPRHDRSVTLAESSVTQYASSCRDGYIQECPMDSANTGGVFHLTAGSQVGVMVNSTAYIAQHREKTFFGMFLLRMD